MPKRRLIMQYYPPPPLPPPLWLAWVRRISGQELMAWWLIALQTAFTPQVPWQGSKHVCLMQALLGGHSPLTRHSGWQLGGRPKKPFWQLQTTLGPSSSQTEKGPQGLGKQDCVGCSGSVTTAEKKRKWRQSITFHSKTRLASDGVNYDKCKLLLYSSTKKLFSQLCLRF